MRKEIIRCFRLQLIKLEGYIEQEMFRVLGGQIEGGALVFFVFLYSRKGLVTYKFMKILILITSQLNMYRAKGCFQI